MKQRSRQQPQQTNSTRGQSEALRPPHLDGAASAKDWWLVISTTALLFSLPSSADKQVLRCNRTSQLLRCREDVPRYVGWNSFFFLQFHRELLNNHAGVSNKTSILPLWRLKRRTLCASAFCDSDIFPYFIHQQLSGPGN